LKSTYSEIRNKAIDQSILREVLCWNVIVVERVVLLPVGLHDSLIPMLESARESLSSCKPLIGPVATQSYNPVAELSTECCVSCSRLYRQHKHWGYILTRKEVSTGLCNFSSPDCTREHIISWKAFFLLGFNICAERLLFLLFLHVLHFCKRTEVFKLWNLQLILKSL
jgi:hypothetical protein